VWAGWLFKKPIDHGNLLNSTTSWKVQARGPHNRFSHHPCTLQKRFFVVTITKILYFESSTPKVIDRLQLWDCTPLFTNCDIHRRTDLMRREGCAPT
jgi:hypothetical protein